MVSIILVNFNTAQMTKECIDSIEANIKDLCHEIIIVDNASSDNSDMLLGSDKRIRYVKNPTNYGFGTANNIGAKMAKGDFLFFLNTDTLLTGNALKDYLDFYSYSDDNQNIGVLGGVLHDCKGDEIRSFGPFVKYSPFSKILLHLQHFDFISTLWNNSHKNKLAQIERDGFCDVDFISGAAMFIPRDVFEKIGGFDEKFFLNYEEIDLQKRLSDSGYRRVVIKSHKIIHFGGGSTTKGISYRSYRISQDSLFTYANKHFRWYQYLLFYICNIVGTIFFLLSPNNTGLSNMQKRNILYRTFLNNRVK